MQKTVFLLGFMGSGKTFWGQCLSEHLGFPFVDLDQRIETGEGMSIDAIFREQGEFAFRILEQQYLHRSAAGPPHILATGGGTPCFFDNMAWMTARGCTVFLDTPADVLAARLRLETKARPLLQDIPELQLESRIDQLLRQRADCYKNADIRMAYTEDNEAFFAMLVRRIAAECGD